mgnify:CR=1 FL=1
MSAKEEFKAIVSSNIRRDGIDKLMAQLEKTDFYTAPASTKYHDSVEGGLVYHSIKVFRALMDLDRDNRYTAETLAIVALFHDLCKVGFYTVEYRNSKNEQGQWVKVPYYGVKDLFPFGHGEKSCFLILEHMKLSNEELMAVRWHMGGFEPKESYGTLSEAYSQYPLAVMLHMADLSATYIK